MMEVRPTHTTKNIFAQKVAQLLLSIILLLCLLPAQAHQNSTAYLTIDAKQTPITVKADIAIRDLLNIMTLDVDYDDKITWGELKAGRQQVFSYFMSHFELQANNSVCPLQASDYKIDQHSDGAYVVLYTEASCEAVTKTLSLNYNIFFEVDARHRAMLKLVTTTGEQGYALSANKSTIALKLDQRDSFVTFVRYIVEGITHIFAGIDHILFLLSLLLPVVLVRSENGWQGVSSIRVTSLDVVKVVTAFTIAHSITFGLVLIKNLSLQINWVEGIIAFSVVIAALNNLIPVVSSKRWLIGFIFGLIHGLGFASVFVDSGLMLGSTMVSLLGFNIGVEIGQLAIVLTFLPVAYLARHGWVYQQLVLKLGSVSIMMIGVYWLIERTIMA